MAKLNERETRILRFSDVNRAASLFHNANPQMKKNTPIDFRDGDVLNLCKALQKNEVKYLLVGGLQLHFMVTFVLRTIWICG